METLSQHERFLAGLPLSDENAALMEGREPASELVFEEKAKTGPLAEDEREWLRRLIHEPGFPVLLKLLNGAIQVREDSVKVLSSSDPLGNKEEVINQWAYVACFRAVMQEIMVIVRSELQDD